MYSCLQHPQLSELVRFLLWELSMPFYIFCGHRVCRVELVDLICSLYSWWEGFGSSSLATLPLGFNCGFISTSACGPSTGVCSWGCPGGLGFAREAALEDLDLLLRLPWRTGVCPVRARCVGAAAWGSGALAAPGTRGSWRLGQQEIQCPRRVWQPGLANTLQYPCLENPPPWQRSLTGQSTGS